VLRDPFWNVSSEATHKLENALRALAISGVVKVIDPVRSAPGLLCDISTDKSE